MINDNGFNNHPTNLPLSLSDMQSIGASKLLGRRSTSSGVPEEITLGTNLSMSGTTLNATGGSGGLADGDYGDITVSGTGTVLTIDNDVVTFAKMQNINTARVLGRTTASTGDVEELSAGSGISIASGQISSTITQYTDEQAQDTVATMIQNGTGISWSYSDVSNTLTPTVTLSPFSTTNLSEGTNLYYTQARFDTAFAAKSTTNLAEGTNLYFTNERAMDAVGNILTNSSTITWTYNDAGDQISAAVASNSSTQKVEVVKNSGAVVGTRKQLNFIEGSNVTLTISDDSVNDQVDITIAASGSGGGNSFETLAVSGQSNIVADSSTDTLTMVAGTDIAITTDAATDTITIAHNKPQLWCMLTADYTLTSSISAQKLFNTTTNGALTLDTGVYSFQCFLYLTTMSATSGNGAFSLGGTATMDRFGYHVTGVDSSTPLAAAARGGSASVTNSSAASMSTAATGTGLTAIIDGMFRVTSSGTIIPSIALVTAAAAVVKAGSWFRVQLVGTSSNTYVGSWS